MNEDKITNNKKETNNENFINEKLWKQNIQVLEKMLVSITKITESTEVLLNFLNRFYRYFIWIMVLILIAIFSEEIAFVINWFIGVILTFWASISENWQIGLFQIFGGGLIAWLFYFLGKRSKK